MKLSEMFPLPEKVTLVHGVTREEKTYTLYPPDCDAMSAVEERFSMPFRDFFIGGRIVRVDGKPLVLRTDEDGSVTYQRDSDGVRWDDANHVAFLLWLFAHQGAPELTEAEVRKQINIYNIDAAVSAVCKTLAKARPTADQAEALKNGSGQEQTS